MKEFTHYVKLEVLHLKHLKSDGRPEMQEMARTERRNRNRDSNQFYGSVFPFL